jgi:nitrogen fixation/metabolism regulation signal transduction histidine kinase
MPATDIQHSAANVPALEHKVEAFMSHPGRKKTFVDPKVQGALVRRLVFHWCAFVAVAALVAFALQVLSNPFRSIQDHAQQVWWTHGPFLLVLVFMLPVFIVDTIKLSHRFAGPIYRMRRGVRSLAQGGQFTPIKFRDFDFWQGLAEDFNKMVERLSSGKTGESQKAGEKSDAEAALSAR